jgi:D-alanyl-D-alanine dipeptidase
MMGIVSRGTRTVFLLLFVVACSAAPVIPANRYGLHVVPDRAAYERLARLDPDKRLVDLESLGLPLDIRYATANNFMKKPLYPVAKAFLRAPAARALLGVESDLAQRGLGVKIFDAYRPYRVTEAMWEPIRNPDFVADPAKGSRHNRGAAVDLTLIDLRTGAELPIPTGYDDFTSRAAHAFTDLPADALANRALLRDVMTRHGFQPLPSEWWHYDFAGWERFELMDVPLEKLLSVVGSPLSGQHRSESQTTDN